MFSVFATKRSECMPELMLETCSVALKMRESCKKGARTGDVKESTSM